jgi:glycosyltransferase involved in cell wall biosynthesis
MSTYDHFYQLAMPQVSDDLRAILLSQNVKFLNFHHWIFLGLDCVDMAVADLGLPTVLTIHEFLAICHHHGQMVTRPARVLCEEASLQSCGDCFPELLRQQFAVRRDRFLDIFRGLKGFVSPSKFLADRFIAWGLDAEKLHVIENGLLGHERLTGEARPHSPGARWTFGYFGQITQFKGVDLLVRACTVIAEDAALAASIQINVYGNMVGQGDAFTEAFDSALKEYSFLSYKGPYVNSTVGALMRACDYVIMLSTWWENSPVVIQEAFGSKRPILCPGIGGMAEKVHDGISGIHFLPGDPSDFVRALRDAADPDRHELLMEGLPAPSSARDMAEHYLEVFKSVAPAPLVPEESEHIAVESTAVLEETTSMAFEDTALAVSSNVDLADAET